MSSCLSVDLNITSNGSTLPKRLYIALIGPNERGRRTVASALKNSPNADLFEFDSYPPERNYLRAVMDNPFNVIILELDSNVEHALELIEEASECSGAAVLAYSTTVDSKLTFRALEAGALAYSIATDASELRQQVDRLAAAYSPVEEESEAASECNVSEPPKTDEHPFQIASHAPAVLPDGFDGWDDHTAPQISCENVTDPEPILPPTLNEREQSGSTFCESLAHTNIPDKQDSSPSKQASANEAQAFWPKTLNDSEEEKPHGDSTAAVEKLLKISTSKLWSGILFSGEKQGGQKLDSAQLHDADQELREMFRRGAGKSFKVNSPKWTAKIAASIGLAVAVLLALGLVFWSRPQPLFTVGQTVVQSPAITMTQTRTSTKPLRPQSTPASQLPLGAK